MPEPWYETVLANEGILQGDIILECPMLDWHPAPLEEGAEGVNDQLKHSVEIVKMDAVIMTQACDLVNHHVRDVVVCPVYSLEQIKTAWEQKQNVAGQNPTPKAWKNLCDDIKDGFIWNYAMLNRGEAEGLATDHRVVDFHDIYTMPVSFLQSIATRQGPRLRLRPPYREHLSQAFARYFMRVGLPSNVEVVW